jgi:hypothetical protein
MADADDGDRSTRRWRLDQLVLAAAGLAAFALGVSVHKDRGNLAVVLVGLGGVLLVLSTFLPRIQTLSGKIAGVEFSVGLVEQPTVTTDRGLAAASAGGGLPPTDLRGAGAPPSGAAGFADATKGGPAEIVVINLEGGRAWLTSRLYVFVAALMELRGIEAVVFTHRPHDRDVVVGIAPACAVLDRLGWAYPWLPAELGAAWDELRSPGDGPGNSRLSAGEADELYQSFVSRLWPGATGMQQPEQWTMLDGGLQEHARWIDAALVQGLLGSDLSAASVREPRSAAERGSEEPESAALAHTGTRYVTVVSDAHEFRSVVDRFAVLEALWNRRTLVG